MKIVAIFASLLSVSLALGCGQVIVDGDGAPGGAGGGGGSDDPTGAGGSAATCTDVSCIGNETSCSCETNCAGPKLRADCDLTDTDTFVCECHYNGNYLGTCGLVGGSACALPGGCCVNYL